MILDEKAVDAAACAIFHAKPRNRIWDALPTEFKNQYRKQARAAITAYQAEAWQDISTAPTLERVFVAGWQPRHGNVAGYWWFYEDTTDENGRPMGHPTATKWQPLPNPPASP